MKKMNAAKHSMSPLRRIGRTLRWCIIVVLLGILVVRMTGIAEQLAYWPSRAEFMTPREYQDVWFDTPGALPTALSSHDSRITIMTAQHRGLGTVVDASRSTVRDSFQCLNPVIEPRTAIAQCINTYIVDCENTPQYLFIASDKIGDTLGWCGFW